MLLVGMLDSPYVRRVAVSAQFLGVHYDHKALSVFNDYDEIRGLNPLVKAPTVICDDGTILVDSTLIIDYFQRISVNGHLLAPTNAKEYIQSQYVLGIALVALEKIVQVTYETLRRPETTRHQPWLDRLVDQLKTAMEQLDALLKNRNPWLLGETVYQADITTAIAWRVSQFIVAKYVDPTEFRELARFSAQAEKLPEFRACPLSVN
ncbi:MAG TPA: glutathione S-transferase family protein [Woeseiaceae bacterium]|nr:glutathione S-transferase family protein [Woeseiaceae bacterium]